MNMLNPLEQAKSLAQQIRQNWFWHHGQRFGFMIAEIMLYLLAALLIALDVYVISKGHRLLVAEVVDGPTRASAYVEDERMTLVLTVGYILLFLFALACFVLARVLRGMRKRRVQVQALCEAVAKL